MRPGRRDPHQINITSSPGAGFIIEWQEDPEGLRPGKGLGPGEGWSGAIANSKTDLWYTYIDMDHFSDVCLDDVEDTYCTPGTLDDFTISELFGQKPKSAVPFAMPVRLTDNSQCKYPMKTDTNGDLLTTQILSTPMGAFQGGPASIGSLHWDNPDGPVTVLFAPIPLTAETNVMETVGIFIPDDHGRFTYDPVRDRARLSFPASAHGPAMEAARRRVALVGRAAGAVTAIDMTALDPCTFHPLGGAVIGKVCDDHGRVLGQRGLYVNDGALIPGSTACANPSLTIAALAERNIDHIVRHDVDTVF